MAKAKNNKKRVASLTDVDMAVDELAAVVKNQFDRVDQRFDDLEARMATKDDIVRLERGQQAMLGVLEKIDAHFEDHRNLPERVARLERSEFGQSA